MYVWAKGERKKKGCGAERKERRKEQGRHGDGRTLGMKGKRAQERKKVRMGSNKSGGEKGRDGRKAGNYV